MNKQTKTTNRPTEFSVTILWGKEQESKDEDGEPYLGSELEFFTEDAYANAETYTFKTKAELDAFVMGVLEANGWLDCYIKASDGTWEMAG